MDSPYVKALIAFLVPSVLSVCCYLIATKSARLISSTPRQMYFNRLIIMLGFVCVWWSYYLPKIAKAHVVNLFDADGYGRIVATDYGRFYGTKMIWMWCVAALLYCPKQKLNNPALPDSPTALNQPL